MTRRLLLPLLLLSGCAQPAHLYYDHGRAYTQAFTAQADLTRPSVANEEYPLYGIEGVEIRLHVIEQTSQQKSADPTLQNN